MNRILERLRGSDRRSIGNANDVVAEVLKNSDLFEEVFDGMLSEDPIIRMRSADAVEKIIASRPDCLQSYKARLIGQVAKIDQQEVRWHVAQMLPRLELSKQERVAVVETLVSYLNDKNSIVKTFAIQALADLAEEDADLRIKVVGLLEKLTKTGSPAMKSRVK